MPTQTISVMPGAEPGYGDYSTKRRTCATLWTVLFPLRALLAMVVHFAFLPIIIVLAILTCNKLTWLGVGTMMDMIMWLMGSNAAGGMVSPLVAKMMQPIMRMMMDKSMHVTEHYNDCTYKEVQDFMVPTAIGKPFTDAPGTFKEGMHPRIKDIGFFGMMQMNRSVMVKSGAPHNVGITYEKFAEHRTRCTPGFAPSHPTVGEVVPDGKILSIAGGAPSTLLTEAKKLAAASGSDKVILSFDGFTCPFYRAYAAEDLWKASNNVPVLHVYLREAEPCDVFDAGGMHAATPLKLKRLMPWHKSTTERAMCAYDCKVHLETFMGKGKVNMWMDTMDDNLEALYEARPWRQYVIKTDGTLIAALGLAPFNMKGKIAVIKEACK